MLQLQDMTAVPGEANQPDDPNLLRHAELVSVFRSSCSPE